MKRVPSDRIHQPITDASGNRTFQSTILQIQLSQSQGRLDQLYRGSRFIAIAEGLAKLFLRRGTFFTGCGNPLKGALGSGSASLSFSLLSLHALQLRLKWSFINFRDHITDRNLRTRLKGDTGEVS